MSDYPLYSSNSEDGSDFPLASWVWHTTGKHIRFYRDYRRRFSMWEIRPYTNSPDWTRLHHSFEHSENERITWENRRRGIYLSVSTKTGTYIDWLNICSTTESSEEWHAFLEELDAMKLPEEKEHSIHLVTQDGSSWDTTKMPIHSFDMNLDLHYGPGFETVNERIKSALRTPGGKGLILLHGLPGTGKTHYLRYLCSQIESKKILFVPPHLAEFITSPQIMPFLIKNKDSILFIEDAERVIMSREDGGSEGVSNILNMTDGLLSDMLHIQIVATFNVGVDQIDQALLRKGRLIAEHRFGKLDRDTSNQLLESLGKAYRTEEPMVLTEIFNVDDEPTRARVERSSIGFGELA